MNIKFILLINVKMPTIVGILTFISILNLMPTIVGILTFVSILNLTSEGFESRNFKSLFFSI